jgi:hypothetical protein
MAIYRNHHEEYLQNVDGETCRYISIWQSQKCLANNSKIEHKKVGRVVSELRGSNSG